MESTSGLGAPMTLPASGPSQPPKGVCVGRKRVARLIRQARIQRVHHRCGVTTTRRNPEWVTAPDLVHREFTATGPNEIRVADITYIPPGTGLLYLAAVINVRVRRVVGRSMRNNMATPLVTDALDMAIARRRPDRVIHHSDRGSQYTSATFPHFGIDGTPRRRVRQCCNRLVLRHPRNRTAPPGTLHHPEPNPIRCLRLHRRLLQPHPATLHHRIPLTRRQRKEHPTTPLTA